MKLYRVELGDMGPGDVVEGSGQLHPQPVAQVASLRILQQCICVACKHPKHVWDNPSQTLSR